MAYILLLEIRLAIVLVILNLMIFGGFSNWCSVLLVLIRFRADSSGDSSREFARSGLTQPELHQQLVSSQRAGGSAGQLFYLSSVAKLNQVALYYIEVNAFLSTLTLF